MFVIAFAAHCSTASAAPTSAQNYLVTQELCDVCAISTSYVAKAVHQLSSKPQVLSLTPHTLQDVLDDVLRVGKGADRDAEALAGVMSAANDRQLYMAQEISPIAWV